MEKTFTKQIKKFVEKENLSLNISVQDRQLVVCGSKSLVDFYAEHPESLQHIFDKMLHKENDPDDSIFKTFKPDVLPKLTANMYDKKAWTGAIPYQNLQTYMLCLGFGRSGTGKSYKNQNDKPEGWPDSISLEHPSYMKKEDMKIVIEALLTHRNIDPKTYYMENTQQRKVIKRRKKNPTTPETVEDEAEEGPAAVDDGDAGDHHQPADLAPNLNNDVNAVENDNMNENVNNNAGLGNIAIENNQNQQPHQPTLDPSGRWYWDYFYGQWYPYYPPHVEQDQNQ